MAFAILASLILLYYYYHYFAHAISNCLQSFSASHIAIKTAVASNCCSRGVLLHIIKDEQSVEEVREDKKMKNINLLQTFFPFQFWHIQVSSIDMYILSIFEQLDFPHK